MKIFILFALLASIANGAILLGKSQCTWGPSYWCKDVKTAKQCSAVSHCQEKQWSPELTAKKETDSLPCQVCKDVFQSVNTLLEKNSTKAEVEQDVMSICTQLPDAFVSECKMAISENFDMIYDEFVMLMNNGGVFCSALGLCYRGAHQNSETLELNKLYFHAHEAAAKNQGNIPVAMMKLEPSVKNDTDECQHCTAFFKDFVNVVKTQKHVVDYWQNLIIQECEMIRSPALSLLCKEELNKEFLVLLDQLAAQDANVVCKDISMCSSTLASRQQSSAKCTDCTNFFTDLTNDIANHGKILASVQTMLEKGCQEAPSFLRSECRNVVDKAVPGAAKMISQSTPETTCETLFFCAEVSKTAAAVAALPSPFISFIPQQPFVNPNCSTCMNFMTDVKKIGCNSHKIADNLVELAVNFCMKMGSSENYCRTKMPEFVLKSIHTGQIMDVDGACGSCANSGDLKQMTFGGDLCTSCDKFAQDWKQNPSNLRSLVTKFLDESCKSHYVEEMCGKQQDEAVKSMLSMISSMNPHDVCRAAFSCDFNTDDKKVAIVKLKKTPLKQPASKQLPSSIACDTCTEVSKALAKVLTEKSTEDEIKKALDEVCTKVPLISQDDCKDLVDVYTPEIIGAIGQGLSGGELCEHLGVCQKKAAVKNDIECELCTTVVSQLDKQISSDSTKAEIEQALSTVCEELPDSLKDTCKNLIVQYTPQLIDLLLQELNPKQVCSTLGLCPESAKKPVAVGDIECELCVTVVKQLDDTLSSNSSKTEIEQALATVCEIVPDSLKETCKSLIDQYTPQLIDLLLQELNPKQVCSTLGLCPESAKRLKVKSEMTCELCHEVASVLDSMIKPGDVKADVEKALGQVCSLIPSQYKELCLNYVDAFAPELIDLLLQELSPKKICSTLGFCSTSSKPVVQKPAVVVAPQKSGEFCGICMLVADQLEKTLSDKATEAEISQALDQVCGLLPGQFSQECQQYVNAYTPMIIDLLTHEYTPQQLCSLMGLCPATLQKVAVKKSSGFCGICVMVANELEKTLSSKSTEAEISQALDQVCGLLPGQFSQECQQYVNTYTPMIIDLLTHEYTPQQLCSLMGLCPATLQKVAVKKSSGFCGICVMVANELEKTLSSKSTEAEIEKALSEVCGLLPGQFSQECQQYVNDYTPLIVDLLTHEVTPRQLCALMGLCPTAAAAQKTATSPAVVAPKQPDYCEVCVMMATQLEKMISEKSTQEEIVGVLNEVCSFLPSPYSQQCKEMMDKYIPMMADLLVHEVTPTQLCDALELCPDVKKNGTTTSLDKVEMKCEMCDMVVGMVDKYVKKNSTKEEIKTAMNGICEILPKRLTSQCHGFVALHLDSIMKMLVNKLSPDHVCALIAGCPANKQATQTPAVVPAKHDPKKKIEIGDDTGCEVCKLIIEAAEQGISANSTEEEIENALKQACTHVPVQSQQFCDDVIMEYVPEIIDSIVSGGDPTKICSKIGLCKQQQKLVGANPCTFGPSFWCANKQNAERCNAVSHCLKHVW